VWQQTGERLSERDCERLPYSVFPLDKVAAAFEHMATGKHVGKIVLTGKGPFEERSEANPDAARSSQLGSRETYLRNLIRGMSVGEGTEVFARVLASNCSRVIVCTQNLDELLKRQRIALRLGPQALLDRESVAAVARPRPNLPTPLVAAGSNTELRLAAIWKDLLGVDEIGVDDDFFELGGDSLVAIRLLARCRDEFHVDQTLAGLLEYPTVAALARRVDTLQTEAAPVSREEAVEQVTI
jgi:acyl carrier protein